MNNKNVHFGFYHLPYQNSPKRLGHWVTRIKR